MKKRKTEYDDIPITNEYADIPITNEYTDIPVDPLKALVPGFTGGVTVEESRPFKPSPKEGLYDVTPEQKIAEKATGVIKALIPFSGTLFEGEPALTEKNLMEGITLYGGGKIIPAASSLVKGGARVGAELGSKISGKLGQKLGQAAESKFLNPPVSAMPAPNRLLMPSLEDLEKGLITPEQKVDILRKQVGHQMGEQFRPTESPKIVYRATQSRFDPKKVGEKGVYVSDTEQVAGYFKGNDRFIEPLELSKNSKVLDYENIPDSIKKIKDWDRYASELTAYAKKNKFDIVYSSPTSPLGEINDILVVNPSKLSQPKRTILSIVQDINTSLGKTGLVGNQELSPEAIMARERLRVDAKNAAKEAQRAGMELGNYLESKGMPAAEADAMRLLYRDTKIPLDKYTEGGSINLTKYETSDDIKQLMNTLTKEQELKIGKQTQTWEQTAKKAEELGWNIKDVKEQWRRKGSFSAAEIDATRNININAITDLKQILDTVPKGSYTPEHRAVILDALDSVRVSSQVATEAGRSLNIFKRVLANDPEFKEKSAIQKVLKVIEGKGGKRTDDVITFLKTIDFTKPAEVNKAIYTLTTTKWQELSDVGYMIWLNMILSNPLTHIRNIVGNTMTVVMSHPERLIGTGVEAIRAKFTGTPRERFFGEVTQDVFATWKGLKDAMSRVSRGGATTSKMEEMPSVLPNFFRKYSPTGALTVEDEFAKGFIESTELNRLAYRTAKMKGYRGQAFKDKVAEYLENPTSDMLEKAAQRAKELTYQNDVGKIGHAIYKLREVIPGGKYFIPFVRTPLNIAKYGLQRTPFNAPFIVKKALKGELTGGELSDEIGKTLFGSLLGAGTYALAAEGYITGGGPKDPLKKDELLRTGWQPYAIKIPGKGYVSFKNFEYISSIVGLSADFYELQRDMTEDEKMTVAKGIFNGIGSVAKNFTNKTYVQGLSNLMDAVNDPGTNMEKLVKGMAGSVVPAVVPGVMRSIDPEIKRTEDIIDKVMSRIPILSKELEPKVNVWGEPLKIPGNAVSRLISPMPFSPEIGAPIDHELVRLKNLTLGMPNKRIGKLDLTPEHYTQLVIDGGQKAKEKLNRLVQKGYYERLTDDKKELEIRKVMTEEREKARDRFIRTLSFEDKRKAKKGN